MGNEEFSVTNGVERTPLTEAGVLKKKHRKILKQCESDLIYFTEMMTLTKANIVFHKNELKKLKGKRMYL